MLCSIPHNWEQNNTNKRKWQIPCNRCSLQNDQTNQNVHKSFNYNSKMEIFLIETMEIPIVCNLNNHVKWVQSPISKRRSSRVNEKRGKREREGGGGVGEDRKMVLGLVKHLWGFCPFHQGLTWAFNLMHTCSFARLIASH